MRKEILILHFLLLIITTSCDHNKQSALSSPSSPQPSVVVPEGSVNNIPSPKKIDRVESKLIRDLENPSAQVRWNAAANLGMLQSPKGVLPLIRALRDKNGQVRLLSAWALGRIRDKRASGELLKAVKDPWIEVRPFAIWALGEIKDPETTEPLVKILFIEKETGTREAIIRTLCSIGNPAAVPALIRALKDDDENVRTEAANALGSFKDQRAIEPLIKSLDDGERYVVMNALVSLYKLRAVQAEKSIRKLANHKDPGIRYKAEHFLHHLENYDFHDIIIEETHIIEKREKELESRSYPNLFIGDISAMNPEDTHNIGTLPIKIGMPVNVTKCVEDLKSKIPDIRSEAAWLLGNSGDKSAVPYLIDSLKDEKPDVRWNAAKSLGKLGDKRAITPLINILKDPDKDVREDVIEALGRLQDKRAVKPLVKVINNKKEHTYIREKGIEALGRIGNQEALEELLTLLKNSYSHIRISAVITLGRLKDKKALDKLGKMKSDPDKSVRECAATAIEVIRGNKNEKDLDTFDDLER